MTHFLKPFAFLDSGNISGWFLIISIDESNFSTKSVLTLTDHSVIKYSKSLSNFFSAVFEITTFLLNSSVFLHKSIVIPYFSVFNFK